MKPRVERDSHHILWTSKNWTANPIGRRLREQPSLIFNIDRSIHQQIHTETPPVPLLSHYALLGTLTRYNATHDPTKDIDNLALCMDRATKGDKFHKLERDLAGIAIETLMLQRPMIMDGIVNNKMEIIV